MSYVAAGMPFGGALCLDGPRDMGYYPGEAHKKQNSG